MDGKTALKLLNSGRCLRIRCWPDNFFIYKQKNKFHLFSYLFPIKPTYKFSDGKILKDLSIFEVNDWEEYDPSAPFFSARCESERLNKLKQFSLEDDIIDL